ncbi:hypothetical protein ACH5RR_005747 [Cinchona calisaya]|uniref:DRBM domain-containing protein n=1 Tax=Cinchona calisaya TaxID=153742 RepID=A0ABD3AM38_9GENT
MYKSTLQELCHRRAWNLPVYDTVKDGPDHCPHFTTTVTVNGVAFESPPNQCKSSKESQNVAAMLAFNFFTASNAVPLAAPAPALPSSPPPPPPPSPGLLALNSNMDVRPAKNDKPLQNLGGNVQNWLSNETPAGHKDENRPKDLLHLYKNRLQHYMQKKNLALPEYSYDFDGPPHARKFRASVMIDGRTFRSPEYYPTLKDAEHAAAKVALESLSLGDIEEDEGLYKSLLQELAQKEGFNFPSYSTVKTGLSHMPTFVSTVQVGGESYQGRECKTKKQSEMNAAKVAYNGLMERRSIDTPSPGCIIKEEIAVHSLSSQPIISDNCRPSTGAKSSTATYEEIAAVEIGQINEKSSVLSHGSDRKERLKSPLPSLDVTNILRQNIQHKPILAVKENLDAEAKGLDTNGKRYRCASPAENKHPHPPEAFTSSSALPTAPSSSALVESDADKTAGGNNPPRSKVIVFRRGSNMKIPEGASILPLSDDQWVAVSLELNQNSQLH